jgi:hypothetical protein
MGGCGGCHMGGCGGCRCGGFHVACHGCGHGHFFFRGCVGCAGCAGCGGCGGCSGTCWTWMPAWGWVNNCWAGSLPAPVASEQVGQTAEAVGTTTRMSASHVPNSVQQTLSHTWPYATR